VKLLLAEIAYRLSEYVYLTAGRYIEALKQADKR
jgi:hypothetical protein